MNHILLTGASSPLGYALAHLLIYNFPKASLTLTGRSVERLQDLKNSLASLAQITLLPLDLLIETERTTLIQWIKDHTPDLLINHAGAGLYGEALTHSIQEQVNILELNTRVVLELSLYAAHALIKQHQRGIIMNISSATDCFTYPTFSVYAASKSCVTNFSRSLDDEMIPYGIRILVSAPGPVATRFRMHAAKGHCKESAPRAMSCKQAAEEIVNQIKTQTPYHVFPRTIKVGRTLLRMLLPRGLLHKLLRKFLKNKYPSRSIAYDQDI
jgi:uncharacterized protein